MPSGAVAAKLILLVAGSTGLASAQAPLFPGDSAQAPAFPTAITLTALGVMAGGQRATRTYPATPGFPDVACDSVTCRTAHSLTGAVGLGARLQAPLGPRLGFRLGVSYSAPKRKVRTQGAGGTFIGAEHLTLIRGEALLLVRLKPQVPVYFGAGAAMARYTPGAVAPASTPGPGATTEFGGAILLGIDRRLKPSLGTRLEWTGFFLVPSSSGLSSEFDMKGLAFDGQLSFGLNLFLKP